MYKLPVHRPTSMRLLGRDFPRPEASNLVCNQSNTEKLTDSDRLIVQLRLPACIDRLRVTARFLPLPKWRVIQNFLRWVLLNLIEVCWSVWFSVKPSYDCGPVIANKLLTRQRSKKLESSDSLSHSYSAVCWHWVWQLRRSLSLANLHLQ